MTKIKLIFCLMFSFQLIQNSLAKNDLVRLGPVIFQENEGEEVHFKSNQKQRDLGGIVLKNKEIESVCKQISDIDINYYINKVARINKVTRKFEKLNQLKVTIYFDRFVLDGWMSDLEKIDCIFKVPLLIDRNHVLKLQDYAYDGYISAPNGIHGTLMSEIGFEGKAKVSKPESFNLKGEHVEFIERDFLMIANYQNSNVILKSQCSSEPVDLTFKLNLDLKSDEEQPRTPYVQGLFKQSYISVNSLVLKFDIIEGCD